MRILLVRPPITLYKREIPAATPPLGLAYIGAVLENSGHDVKIYDCIIEDYENAKTCGDTRTFGSFEKAKKAIKTLSPEFVGITCPYSIMFENALKIARMTKETNNDIKTLIGGAHPSALPKICASKKGIDYVVIGEGEETAKKIIEGDKPEKLDGVVFKKGNKIIIKPKTRFIKNLDYLPFPARHLLNMNEYLNMPSHCGYVKRKPHTNIITSRGCPGKCVFCSIQCVWGNTWRMRSAKNVLDEIEMLVNDYCIREIHFEDDNLTLNRKRAKEIFQGIIERKLDISWTTPNGVAINTLNDELLRLMKKSGCYALSFGIEHGDARMQKEVVKKIVPKEQAKKVVKECKNLGIWTHGFFIVGLPQETRETYNNTLNFAKEACFDSASFFIALPLPGSPLFEQFKGKVDFNELRTFGVKGFIKNEFKPKELLELQKNAYKEMFLFRLKKELNPMSMLSRVSKIKNKNDLRFYFNIAKRFLQVVK